jgi:hypothetical protein
MRAAGTLPMRMAGQHQPPLGLAGVDPAEARGGEGHEQPRMLVDRLGHALAALEPSGEQLVGIHAIGGRTRGAAGLAAGAAGLQQHPVRLPPRVIDGADLPGLVVGLVDSASKADGVVAVAGLSDELGPPRIAVAGPLHDLPEHPRQHLTHPHRPGHEPPSGHASSTHGHESASIQACKTPSRCSSPGAS